MLFMQAIHEKIQSLGFKDCHAKIRHVDCQETIGNAVVIQVLVSLSAVGLVIVVARLFEYEPMHHRPISSCEERVTEVGGRMMME